jgi:multiple sugar transport system substrate-binding protein
MKRRNAMSYAIPQISSHAGAFRPTRRSLLLGAAAAASFGATAPFGHADAADDQSLVFWSQFAGSKKPAGDALEAAFKAANPGIRLNSSLYADPKQLNEKLLTAINGNTAPDIFVQHWDYTLNYADGGKLLDLKKAMPDLDFATLDESLLVFSAVGGNIYSIPMYGTSRGIGFNRALVKEAGLDPDKPPRNWDELRTWAKAMTKRAGGMLQVAGINLYQNDLETWELYNLLLQGAGGAMFTDDLKKPAFAGPEGVRALKFMIALVHEDKVTDLGFGQGGGGAANPFNQGRAAMEVAGNYSVVQARRGGVDIDVAPFPAEKDGFTTLVDPFSFGIPVQSKSQKAALAFLRFALSEDQQVKFAVESKNVPLLKAAQKNPALASDPILPKFVECGRYAPKTSMAIPAFSRVTTLLARAVQEALFKRMTPEEALAGAAAEVTTILSRG